MASTPLNSLTGGDEEGGTAKGSGREGRTTKGSGREGGKTKGSGREGGTVKGSVACWKGWLQGLLPP